MSEEGLDCKVPSVGRQRVGEDDKGCEKQHDWDLKLHGGARLVSFCVDVDGVFRVRGRLRKPDVVYM